MMLFLPPPGFTGPGMKSSPFMVVPYDPRGNGCSCANCLCSAGPVSLSSKCRAAPCSTAVTTPTWKARLPHDDFGLLVSLNHRAKKRVLCWPGVDPHTQGKPDCSPTVASRRADGSTGNQPHSSCQGPCPLLSQPRQDCNEIPGSHLTR